jgi:hypothetical protein
VACPFFSPAEPASEIASPHPRRLPLGASWRGVCSAPGYEQDIPNPIELESCNLGYAKSCPRLPLKRNCDAVRFSISKDSGERLVLQFVFESNYLPAGDGLLEYDLALRTWISPHPEARLQRLAECFLQSYLNGKTRS